MSSQASTPSSPIFEEINDDDKAFNHYMDDIILKLSNVETMTDANEATRLLQKDISGEDSTGRVYAIKALEDLFKESLMQAVTTTKLISRSTSKQRVVGLLKDRVSVDDSSAAIKSVNEEIINNCANINVNIQDTLGGTELSELAMNSEYGASTCPCETCET
ncbi:hypothetical protein RhiirC2_856848 [Rhizophagus irregularis]|uniref:Uncharacterized protein n=1 Tax=Rhizophagus irregularis TaxID=588596 RepID=A0A2N1MFV9_9GLOM|nr:hypothetical protein RhiirC2_856848 [Rhizophagus irregularis]